MMTAESQVANFQARSEVRISLAVLEDFAPCSNGTTTMPTEKHIHHCRLRFSARISLLPPMTFGFKFDGTTTKPGWSCVAV